MGRAALTRATTASLRVQSADLEFACGERASSGVAATVRGLVRSPSGGITMLTFFVGRCAGLSKRSGKAVHALMA
jgi:hypothetical protein